MYNSFWTYCWGIAIAVHGIFIIGHIAYDKLNKKNFVRKFNKIKLEGNENKNKRNNS